MFIFDYDFSNMFMLMAIVSIIDFCMGVFFMEMVMLQESVFLVMGVDLIVCGDINLLLLLEYCEVFFFMEQINVDFYEVQFYDLLSIVMFVEFWFWDFGDGNMSNEVFFLYIYVVMGVYDVLLIIIVDICIVIFINLVYVEDFVFCDCDWNEYDLVCIEVVFGIVEFFEIFCYVECVGYSVDDIVDCSDNGFDFCEVFFIYE